MTQPLFNGDGDDLVCGEYVRDVRGRDVRVRGDGDDDRSRNGAQRGNRSRGNARLRIQARWLRVRCRARQAPRESCA